MSEDHKEKKSAFAKASADKTDKKAAEYLDGWKRAKADLINYRKQVEGEKQDLIKYANVGLIIEVLPIYNNLKLAAKHVPEADLAQDWVKGILQIKKQFKDFLQNLGIEEIKTVGQDFNPEMHEAVVMEDNDEYQSGAVFEEVAPGYTYQDKVLQAAKVKVAK